MDISLLGREQLKDIIRANHWDDKPALTVSEKEMEVYLQDKINEGELRLDNVAPNEDENSDASLVDTVTSVTDEVEKEAPVEPEDSNSDDSSERVVKVALLRPAYVEAGVKVQPEFDGDGIATVIVEIPLSVAKAWQKNGICHING